MRCLILEKYNTSFGLVYVIEFSQKDPNPFIGQRLKYTEAIYEITGISFEHNKTFDSTLNKNRKNYGIMAKEITSFKLLLEIGAILEF